MLNEVQEKQRCLRAVVWLALQQQIEKHRLEKLAYSKLACVLSGLFTVLEAGYETFFL
jgi:hypothetical protein